MCKFMIMYNPVNYVMIPPNFFKPIDFIWSRLPLKFDVYALLCRRLLFMYQAQGLVTIHVNILSMYKHVQGRTPFLPPLASSRVCFLNSF